MKNATFTDYHPVDDSGGDAIRMDISETMALPSFYWFGSISFNFLEPKNLTQGAYVKTRGKFEIVGVKS
jgi:hypothetical protein